MENTAKILRGLSEQIADLEQKLTQMTAVVAQMKESLMGLQNPAPEKKEEKTAKHQIIVESSKIWIAKVIISLKNGKVDLIESETYGTRKTVENIREQIEMMFTLTGASPDVLTVTETINECEEIMDTASFYKLVYAIPIPSNVRFIRLGTCRCNMGYCAAPVSVSFERETKTFGDAFALWASKIGDSELQYYDYPEMWILYLNSIDTLPDVHEGGTCLGNPVKLQTAIQDEMDKLVKMQTAIGGQMKFIAWSYGR